MCNRMFRRASQTALLRDKLLPVRLREVLDEWNLGGDGKHRIHRDDNYYKKHFANRLAIQPLFGFYIKMKKLE